MVRYITVRAESTRIGDSSLEKSHSQRRSISTVRMVQTALQDLEANSKKGITLYAVKKYISNTFEITLNARRKNIINNYLRQLLMAGDLTNIKGKGLSGHFRYVAKIVRVNNKRKSRGRQTNQLSLDQLSNAPLRPSKASVGMQPTLLLETPRSSQGRKRHASVGMPSLGGSDIETEQPRPRLKSKKKRLFNPDNV